MQVDFNLQNLYYPWNHFTQDFFECWWKGTIFIDNKMIEIDDIRDFFVSKNIDLKNDVGEIETFLRRLNGSFAIVLQTANSILCIVDRVRSIPLFYSSIDSRLIISDDAQYLQNLLRAPFSEEHGVEFLVTGYVTGTDTLFEGIQQIQAGEYLVYNESDGNYSLHRYFQYLHRDYSDEPEDHLIKRLDELMVGVFNRLTETIIKQGKTIVVPLSGGLDSRLVVAMLKRLGVKDVICFSYGEKGNLEAKISKEVAESLGYTWYFIEYTKKKWYECYHSDEMQTYEKFAGNLTSLPYLQDYLAVKFLKEEGKIPINAVIIPGHSGDFLAGSYIPLDYNRLQHYSIENFLKETRNKHYCLWKWNDEAKGTIFLKQRIQKTTNDIPIYDIESYVNVVDFFVFNEKVAKFIVNSVRLYEFFGYEWRIPLWDTELMDFFLKIPLKFRINQNLYIKYAVEYVFNGKLIDLMQIECTTSLKNKSNEIFVYKILNKLTYYYFTFNLGVACTEKYPILSRIRDKIFGHPYRIFPKFTLINDILKYSHNNKFKPSGNGLTSLGYLTRIINYRENKR